jgi:hypothetical protein
VLKYLCIWEMEDASPLKSEMYKSQRARPSWIRAEAEKYITQRARGLYSRSTRWKVPSRTTPVPTPSLWPLGQPKLPPIPAIRLGGSVLISASA